MLLAATGSIRRVQAQGLTGQISGTVTDSGGGVMPGATVTVKNTGTNLTRDAVTGADGTFYFPTSSPARTTSRSPSRASRPTSSRASKLGATERLALRAIALEVGALSEQVTVQAEAALGADDQRGALRPGHREKIEDIALKGRDFAGI